MMWAPLHFTYYRRRKAWIVSSENLLIMAFVIVFSNFIHFSVTSREIQCALHGTEVVPIR